VVQHSVAIVGEDYTGLQQRFILPNGALKPSSLRPIKLAPVDRDKPWASTPPTFHFQLDFAPGSPKKPLGSEKADRLIPLQTGAVDLIFPLVDKYGIDCELIRAGSIHAAQTPSMMSALEGKFADYQSLERRTQFLDHNLDGLGQVPRGLGLPEYGQPTVFELCTRTRRGCDRRGYESFRPYIGGSTGTIRDDMAGHETARHRIGRRGSDRDCGLWKSTLALPQANLCAVRIGLWRL
jgi:hypothetical protein